MKPILLAVLLGIQACAIGPRRLQKDCTWSGRPETTAENAVGWISATAILGGLGTFVGAFFAHRGDIAGPAFAVTGAGILGLWWTVGAFEEVPVGRYARCQKEVWRKP